MSRPAQLDRVTYIVLRFMRAPALVLVVVYAVSIGGMVLIPGPAGTGEDGRLGFFHAFYFLTYTATTTGFGELPHPFSEAQRMWAIVSLYASVIAWIYAIGSIFQLVQNPHFQQALDEWRFARQVERIDEPFVIVCGFGNTGSLLTRGLSDAGLTAVVLDGDPERIKALRLRDYRVTMPGLAGNARDPRQLVEAGLARPNCKAVVALTNDERVNQKIAVTAALLNPDAMVVTLSTAESYREVLASLSPNTHVIDPFQTYARFLGAALAEPRIHMLNSWILGVDDARLVPTFDAPRGRWILCGYGRMGHRLEEVLTAIGVETAIIESDVVDAEADRDDVVEGRVTAATLEQAGIGEASGIVAGTNNDYDNLAIVVTARSLNPATFAVVRQNFHENQLAFAAARADLIMQPSLVSARRILLLLIAPLMRTLFARLGEAAQSGDHALIERVVDKLRERVGGTRPRVWTVALGPETASALLRREAAGEPTLLGDAMRDARDRSRPLDCVALVHHGAGTTTVLPGEDRAIRIGDEILFCGSAAAQHLLDATLNNWYTLEYVVTGEDPPRGFVMRWLLSRRAAQRSATGAGPDADAA